MDPLDAEEYYSVQPPDFVWDGTMGLGRPPEGRARDIYTWTVRGRTIVALELGTRPWRVPYSSA